ncbi:MAG: CRISPR-associated protein Cas4 [Cytophagales bacterium]|nr:CRISPR-associated protein Cas4 [Cytophagales bacterium]
MQINATLINLYHVCHRELWLHANGVRMEHTSEVVAEGKLIGETTYTDRSQKFTEVEIDGVKIDFYDAKNKVVHEVKKSASVEKAHIAQVQYYLYKLKQKGVDGVTGIIEYPKLKQREVVNALTPHDVEAVVRWEQAIEAIITSSICPNVIRAKICKPCSYYDFCYSTEI